MEKQNSTHRLYVSSQSYKSCPSKVKLHKSIASIADDNSWNFLFIAVLVIDKSVKADIKSNHHLGGVQVQSKYKLYILGL